MCAQDLVESLWTEQFFIHYFHDFLLQFVELIVHTHGEKTSLSTENKISDHTIHKILYWHISKTLNFKMQLIVLLEKVLKTCISIICYIKGSVRRYYVREITGKCAEKKGKLLLCSLLSFPWWNPTEAVNECHQIYVTIITNGKIGHNV